MRGYVVEIIDSTCITSSAEVNGARYICFYYCYTQLLIRTFGFCLNGVFSLGTFGVGAGLFTVWMSRTYAVQARHNRAPVSATQSPAVPD